MHERAHSNIQYYSIFDSTCKIYFLNHQQMQQGKLHEGHFLELRCTIPSQVQYVSVMIQNQTI